MIVNILFTYLLTTFILLKHSYYLQNFLMLLRVFATVLWQFYHNSISASTLQWKLNSMLCLFWHSPFNLSLELKIVIVKVFWVTKTTKNSQRYRASNKPNSEFIVWQTCTCSTGYRNCVMRFETKANTRDIYFLLPRIINVSAQFSVGCRQNVGECSICTNCTRTQMFVPIYGWWQVDLVTFKNITGTLCGSFPGKRAREV